MYTSNLQGTSLTPEPPVQEVKEGPGIGDGHDLVSEIKKTLVNRIVLVSLEFRDGKGGTLTLPNYYSYLGFEERLYLRFIIILLFTPVIITKLTTNSRSLLSVTFLAIIETYKFRGKKEKTK